MTNKMKTLLNELRNNVKTMSDHESITDMALVDNAINTAFDDVESAKDEFDTVIKSRGMKGIIDDVEPAIDLSKASRKLERMLKLKDALLQEQAI